MKFAVIADTHGNLPALTAVLEDARAQGAEGCLFAGDYCLGMPYPNEVAWLLRSAKNARIVCGNEENYTRNLAGKGLADCESGQMRPTYWVAQKLTPENLAFLNALPRQLDFEEEGVPIHMTHSSADFIGLAEHRDFSTSKMALRYGAGTTHGKVLRDIRESLEKDGEFKGRLTALAPGVYIFGHCHIQWYADFGTHLFLDPGSCGLPLDCCEEGAPYSLLTVGNGDYSVEERRVPYDVQALACAMEEGEQYRADFVWSNILRKEILTRREGLYFFLKYAERYAQSIGDPVRPLSPKTWEGAFEEWERDHTAKG